MAVKKRVVVAENEAEGAPAKKQKVEKEEVKTEGESSANLESSEDVIRKIKEQARVAVASLIKYVGEKGDKSLFPEADHGISVMVTYKKPAVENGPTQKKRVILPHPPLTASSAMFCVIMPDLDVSNGARHDPQVDKQSLEWEEKIEAAHGLTRKHIAKILTKRQLEREYQTYKAKRQLASAYDVFLVEKTVHKTVHSFLGKEFVKAHKMPLSFDFTGDMPDVMKKAVGTSIYDLSANRVRVAVSSGHLSQPHADIVENVEHVVNEIVSNCPGGFVNVRSLFVQLSSSTPSLPIYTDDGSANEVKLSSVPKLRKVEETVKGELSTLPEGLEVVVSRDGRVRVVKEQTGETVIYPTDKDEWTDRDAHPRYGLKPKANLEKIAKKRKSKKRRSMLKNEKATTGGIKVEERAFEAIAKGAKKKTEEMKEESEVKKDKGKKRRAEEVNERKVVKKTKTK